MTQYLTRFGVVHDAAVLTQRGHGRLEGDERRVYIDVKAAPANHSSRPQKLIVSRNFAVSGSADFTPSALAGSHACTTAIQHRKGLADRGLLLRMW